MLGYLYARPRQVGEWRGRAQRKALWAFLKCSLDVRPHPSGKEMRPHAEGEGWTYLTFLRCIKMMGNSGSFGDGSMYWLLEVTQPVKCAVEYTSQSAPYSRGASGTCVAMRLPRAAMAVLTAEESDGLVVSRVVSAVWAAALW